MTTPDRDYRFPPEPLRAVWDRETANRVLGSIGERLRALENKRSELQALIDDLSFNGQARIDEAITPLIETQRGVLVTLASDIDREIERINALFQEFDLRTQAALETLDTAVDTALAEADERITLSIAQINAEVATVRERVDAILAGGLPAADVNEDDARVFVTPEQKAALPQSDGKVGGAFGGHVDFAAGTADAASISIPQGIAPTAPENGDVWLTANGLSVRANGATRSVYDTSNMPLASQADAESGAGTGLRAFTPQRIAQAIAALTGPERTLIAPTTFTAVKHQQYRFVGTTACTATLPAAPVVGDTIRFLQDGSEAVHRIARNGRTIMGVAEDLNLNAQGYDFTLWWNGSDWRLF